MHESARCYNWDVPYIIIFGLVYLQPFSTFSYFLDRIISYIHRDINKLAPNLCDNVFKVPKLLKCLNTLCHWLKAVYWRTPANQQFFLSQWNQYSFFIARQFFTCRKLYILIVACNIISKHFLKLIIIILIKSTLHTQKNNFGMNKKNEDKIILIFESGWRQTYTRKIRKAKQKKNQVYTNMKKKTTYGWHFIFR